MLPQNTTTNSSDSSQKSSQQFNWSIRNQENFWTKVLQLKIDTCCCYCNRATGLKYYVGTIKLSIAGRVADLWISQCTGSESSTDNPICLAFICHSKVSFDIQPYDDYCKWLKYRMLSKPEQIKLTWISYVFYHFPFYPVSSCQTSLATHFTTGAW